MSKRKTRHPEFKAKVASEALMEEETVRDLERLVGASGVCECGSRNPPLHKVHIGHDLDQCRPRHRKRLNQGRLNIRPCRHLRPMCPT